jgi:hypothetical protein
VELCFDSGIPENAARFVEFPHGSSTAGSGIYDQ